MTPWPFQLAPVPSILFEAGPSIAVDIVRAPPDNGACQPAASAVLRSLLNAHRGPRVRRRPPEEAADCARRPGVHEIGVFQLLRPPGCGHVGSCAAHVHRCSSARCGGSAPRLARSCGRHAARRGRLDRCDGHRLSRLGCAAAPASEGAARRLAWAAAFGGGRGRATEAR